MHLGTLLYNMVFHMQCLSVRGASNCVRSWLTRT